jgi:hypothetical protein
MNAEELLTQALRYLEILTIREIDVPAAYAKVNRAEKQGKLQLESRFFEVQARGHFRSVYICAPKIDVFSFFFYPLPHFQLPIFATEFVRLGNRPIVAVIDAKCLIPSMTCRESVVTTLQQAHQSFPHLENADDPPDWYSACRSGYDFFVRPRDLPELETTMQACLHVWRDLVKIIHQHVDFGPAETETHARLIQDYKQHHRENSPGLPLLNRSFGPAWTNEYLSQYFFA